MQEGVIKPWWTTMSDLSSEYETRAAIEAQMELAQQARSSDRPNLTAFWPIGIYLCIATVVMVGTINGTSNANRTVVPAATAALQRAALDGAPLGGTAGISHASPTIDAEEAQHRLCITAESCVDVPVAPARSKQDATAHLPTAP